MKVLVGHHDRCFDGVASAALFTHLHRTVAGAGHDYEYLGLSHGPVKDWDDSRLTGDENAVVDFRFLASPKLHWWFDHHRTAFELPGDEEAFRADRSGRKFFDPESKSCARLLADVGRERFGVDWGFRTELIEEAHVIDGALWATAEEAAEFESPAARLRMVLEAGRRPDLLLEILRGWVDEPMSEVARRPAVATLADAIAAREAAARGVVRASGRPFGPGGEVVLLDVIGRLEEGFSKFFAYAEFPQALYILTLTAGASRTKIGLGFNPWAGRPRLHDVSAICRRHGGGGHPVVGAMSFPPGDAGIVEARAVADDVIRELLSPPTAG